VSNIGSKSLIDLKEVQLNEASTKGLGTLVVSAMKESVIEINEELKTAGQCLRAVASNLYEIKLNVKPGNWKAFLESGAINCTPKYASDLVSAHEKWLINADVDDSLIALLSPRSLAAMANATEAQRKRVYKLREAKGKERLSESEVRKALKGNKKNNSKQITSKRSIDERLNEKNSLIYKLTEQNKLLKDENIKLRSLIGNPSILIK
tara:strand:- start:16 stop:639 length:624 start_codon:yes stop_codon:yes gene_type:complete